MQGKPSCRDLLCLRHLSGNMGLGREHPAKGSGLHSPPTSLPTFSCPPAAAGKASPFQRCLYRIWQNETLPGSSATVRRQQHTPACSSFVSHRHIFIILRYFPPEGRRREGPECSGMCRLKHRAGSSARLGRSQVSDLEKASHILVFSLTLIISLNRLPQLIYFEQS